MTKRETLEKEIDALDRMIRSNKASLRLKTLSASDRTLLEMQIKTRGRAVTALRQQLEDLSGTA
ncbi:hypothetical protein [Rhodoferax sp.]|uniref:hypothetical protein n=1 Tax=Rhodoferax sp. TaxID=50421 RepID=UPI002764359B|nr:hypothetical protein [Rhodoferax sp.]